MLKLRCDFNRHAMHRLLAWREWADETHCVFSLRWGDRHGDPVWEITLEVWWPFS